MIQFHFILRHRVELIQLANLASAVNSGQFLPNKIMIWRSVLRFFEHVAFVLIQKMFRDLESTLVRVWAEKRRVRNVFAFFDSKTADCIRDQMLNDCFWIKIVSMSCF